MESVVQLLQKQGNLLFPGAKIETANLLSHATTEDPKKLHSIFLLDSIGQNRSLDSAQIQGKAKQLHLLVLEW